MRIEDKSNFCVIVKGAEPKKQYFVCSVDGTKICWSKLLARAHKFFAKSSAEETIAQMERNRP